MKIKLKVENVQNLDKILKHMIKRRKIKSQIRNLQRKTHDGQLVLNNKTVRADLQFPELLIVGEPVGKVAGGSQVTDI